MKFDDDNKITTIQQSWDQGALLKQLDVIGKTGRNWPIRDSQDQIKLITRSGGKPAEPTPSQTVQRSVKNSTNATRDPHASLHQTGFSAPRDEEPARVVSPFSGTRPRQRTFEEILGDEPNDGAPDQSPSKAVAPKIGAGKNFPASRLFEKPEDEPSEPESPDDGRAQKRFMKPHPTKYNHFSFADGSDPADAPEAGEAFDAIKSKHRSQWDFSDFVTPQKPVPSKSLRQQARHWGTDQDDYDESPAKPSPGMAGGKARRDADTQIELQDDGEDNERGQRAGARPRGAMHNSGLGLYKNHMVSDDGSEPIQEADPRALGNITNLKNRHDTFDPHFKMTDSPPGSAGQKPSAPVPEDRKKVVNMMQANWSTYDESPNSRKENSKPSNGASEDAGSNRGIRTAGDGMGNPKGRNWTTTSQHGGIKLGGDGMGNPKGGRGWSIGDDSEEEKDAAPVPGRKGAAQKAANSFWEF